MDTTMKLNLAKQGVTKLALLILTSIIIAIITSCDFDINFEPPVIANFTATPNSGSIPLSVNFICDASDPDGEIANYEWDFGDSESVATFSGDINHIYREMESFTVFVAVTDNDGLVDTSSIIIDASAPISVSDNFNDGIADGWFESDDGATYRVENGEFSIESPNDGYQHRTMHPFGPKGDFSFEAKVIYISGNLGSPYGIGIFDSDDRFTWLFIKKYGSYKLTYYENSGWHDISSWSSSSFINTSVGIYNILKLQKSGSSLNIYVNNSHLGAFSSSSIGEVKEIGLYVQDDLHVHFDDIVAEEL